MAEQWYVYKNQEQKGPYSIDEFKRRIQNGELSNTDLYWNESIDEWTQGNHYRIYSAP
ncbi:MAG: DUF4339 domain-containing protein [Clostridia bacterium]